MARMAMEWALFQSTPPREGVTDRLATVEQWHTVSIHTPP